jgi:hypothetical protein
MQFFAPLPSRDGRRVFAVGWKPQGELVRYDAGSGHFVPYLSGISAHGALRKGIVCDRSRGTVWERQAAKARRSAPVKIGELAFSRTDLIVYASQQPQPALRDPLRGSSI